MDELRRVGPEAAVLPAGTRLYRIHSRGGKHPTGWGRMRHYGPVGTAPFDHHSEPAWVQERRGILYAAAGSDAVATCVADAFQEDRLVDTYRDAPWLACFALAEDVALLDLTGKWSTRAGASANVNSGLRPRCRRWSRVIHEAYPDLQGLLYASSMNGGGRRWSCTRGLRVPYRSPPYPTDHSPIPPCWSGSAGSPTPSGTVWPEGEIGDGIGQYRHSVVAWSAPLSLAQGDHHRVGRPLPTHAVKTQAKREQNPELRREKLPDAGCERAFNKVGMIRARC